MVGSSKSGEMLSAWDLKLHKHIWSLERAASTRPYARTQVVPVRVAYQNLFLVFDGDYTFVDFIRDRPNRHLREEDDYVVITALGDRTLRGVRANNFGLRLQLDPTRGFMPVKVTYLLQDSDVPQSQWTNELYEPQEGLWVPRKSVMNVYCRDKDTPHHGEIVGQKVVSIDTTQASFNTPIDPSVFSPDIPPGYEVHDGRVIVK